MQACRNVDSGVEFFIENIRSSEEARLLIKNGGLELFLEMDLCAFRIPLLGGARERLGRKIYHYGKKFWANYIFVDNYFYCYETSPRGVIVDKYARGQARFYRFK